jgi:spermidine/putrescine transport system substrate-binding protein
LGVKIIILTQPSQKFLVAQPKEISMSNRSYIVPKLVRLLLFVLIVSWLAACDSLAAPPAPTPAPTPIPAPASNELIFYDWGDGMPSTVVEAFTEQHGIEVTYLAYDSQEEAVNNMKAGETYDLVVLENQFVPDMINEGLLAEIDYRNIPNFKHVLANFRDLNYDPGNKHSVPFTWGTTAFLVTTDYEGQVTSWVDLWELHSEGKIGIRDGARESLGFALKSLGYSINSEDPAQLEEALQRLLEIKQDIVLVDSYAETAVPVITRGDVVAMIGWTEDALYAREENEPLVYVFPGDGTMLWGDNFVIPANSPNKENAELFLNFILEPEFNAEIVNETYYATANEAARSLVNPEIQEDTLIFPPIEVLQNAEVILPLSPESTKLYDQTWERFKSELE